jgi:1-phosphatidylinositol-4-phosphate 5-kinase
MMEEERARMILATLCRLEQILQCVSNPREVEDVTLDGMTRGRSYNTAEFKAIRKLDDVCDFNKIDTGYIINERLKGKSGSLLFFTRDFRFAIKTVKESEIRCLRSIMHSYQTHLLKNPYTFICRIYGCYSITAGSRSESFIVMSNLFKNTRIGEIYDLKGGRLPRRGSKTSISKDVDWILNKRHINLKDRRKRVLEQIREDVVFLRCMRIMDYSILINIPSERAPDSFVLHESPGVGLNYLLVRDPGSCAYDICFGIVDILTRWSLVKMLERIMNLLCCNTNISCVHPDMYAERFLKMIESHCFNR